MSKTIFTRNFKQWTLLLVALGSQVAHAQWSNDARKYVEESVKHPFENTYLATAWDVFQIPSYKIATIANTRIVSVPTPYLTKKSTRVIVHTAANPKAPLVVLNPGMFSNLENHQFTFDIKVFADLGMHVILLPNPWDKDIIGGGVTYIPGDLQSEAKMLYEVAEATLRMEAARIQPTSIKLIGYSYGAFMGAVMTEIDSRKAKPLFNAGSTLVGPPLQMGHSLANFDVLLNEEEALWAAIPLSTQFALLTELRRLKVGGTPSERLLKHSRALAIYGGFHRNLIVALRHWYAGITEFGGDAVAKERLNRLIKHMNGLEENDVRFMPILNLFPEVAHYLEDAGQLSYYLRKAEKQNPNVSIRIFYSENDFLNTDLRWQDHDIKSEWTLPMPIGGHNGFKSLPWFREMLSKHFF